MSATIPSGQSDSEALREKYKAYKLAPDVTHLRRRFERGDGAGAMLVVAASCGCTVMHNEFRTLIDEPIKYGPNADRVRTKKRNKKIAKARRAIATMVTNGEEPEEFPDHWKHAREPIARAQHQQGIHRWLSTARASSPGSEATRPARRTARR